MKVMVLVDRDRRGGPFASQPFYFRVVADYGQHPVNGHAVAAFASGADALRACEALGWEVTYSDAGPSPAEGKT